MSGHVGIRPAARKDIDAMGALWAEFMDFHAERDPWFKRSESGHTRFAEFIAERLEDERSIVLVAETDGEVVGHALAMIAKRLPVFEPEDYAQIMDVAVAGKHRRSGIGMRLVQEMMRLFRQRGIRRVEVTAAVTNEVATAFWRKMGFVPYTERSWLSIGEPDPVKG
jgi:ribosomal protein S18 acetylase RimI-like enzyme